MEDDSIREALYEAKKRGIEAPEEALVRTRTLLTRTRSLGNKQLEVLALANMANHFSDLNEWQKSLTYCSLAIRTALEHEIYEHLIGVYITQAILQFRTLKINSAFGSLADAWTLVKKFEPNVNPVERCLLLQFSGTYTVICGDYTTGIPAVYKAIPYALAAGADYFGAMAYSLAAVYQSWVAMEPNCPDPAAEVAKARELVRQAEQYPIVAPSDGGFFYHSAIAEISRVEEKYLESENALNLILNGATNSVYYANLHSVAARSALMRLKLGDSEGALERLDEMMGRLGVPASRVLIPQSLRIGLTVAEELDRMDYYNNIAKLYKLWNDRVNKAKKEANLRIRSLDYFVKEIY
jgi:tetratricopeptide (TPR) repeat protein